ncbi:MAG: bifunctional phosphoribosylaminoimidazolecarboxamide formyltransferase/IMP cyclohydrolase, partial [Verrucomicrobiales bacterium]|nr:bifunctional phosphoribosylaminoimidazolecarboxamide formyltransferase/IMP cyclohydrolase [Verrucomicrobiales bacterium]
MPIQRALLSVSDKTGLLDFAQGLAARGVEILSTGGTAKFLAEGGVPVCDVSAYTGFPELFDGRVKTLHPKVHGGLLQRRGHKQDEADAAKHEIPCIDLVAINLYPFEQTVAKKDVTLEEAIENIDIGGPSMLRSAAKNHKSVTVLCDPEDYQGVLTEMDEHDGDSTLATRERLAWKVFHRTSQYDAAIANFLNKEQVTQKTFNISLPLCCELRYGDNPHQAASLYGNFGDYFAKLHGKDLSYTNVLDIQGAAGLINEFRRPTLAILKHTNPCGVGSAEEDLREAWQKAFETDKQAPFGGVIVINRSMPLSLARVISEIFTDIIIAPDFDADARAHLQKKKNLRLIQMLPTVSEALSEPIIRSAPGGLMVMDPDPRALGLEDLENKVRTKRPPTREELEAMRFAWRVVKHVKSNAIVFAKGGATVGVGAGQMNRVQSVRLAAWQAGERARGSVLASDAFFPFAD